MEEIQLIRSGNRWYRDGCGFDWYYLWATDLSDSEIISQLCLDDNQAGFEYPTVKRGKSRVLVIQRWGNLERLQ